MPKPVLQSVFDGREALLLEIRHPAFVLFRVGLPAAVENEQARLRTDDGVKVGVPARNRDPRVDHLADEVDELEVFLHPAARLGHMAGIPLDMQRIVCHQVTPPKRDNGKSTKWTSPSSSRRSTMPTPE
jgi:hypothetical protein